MRRVAVARARRREQAQLAELDQQPARLREEFATVRAADLLAHFRSRTRPGFFRGFQDFAVTARLQEEIFPDETARLVKQAERIAGDGCWPLLGFGEKCFGAHEIQWNRDPLSGFSWPRDYHANINLIRHDGSDARVVWELNRCAHFITLGRAYAITNEDNFSAAFFRQLESWRAQNPVGRGVNWNCAMEVALRAMNLLAAFGLFLRAPQMNELALTEFLKMLDQHGAHIQRNLEFSHIATSNHYLADVVGLLWIGLMLPELSEAREWQEFGFRELLNEMDKQVLPDGADYEASTGYHRLKAELWLYSFMLCELNGLDVHEKYWRKLRGMIDYIRAYLRSDGRAPLIGDSDSGQVLPITRRTGDDHAYVLAVAAAVFGTHASGVLRYAGLRPAFVVPDSSRLSTSEAFVPEDAGGVGTELLWLLGERGVRDYDALPASEPGASCAFSEAGVYILRHDDLYLHFNAGGIGVNGRGSHGHNDALSLEVSACGSAFIVDPGTYLYTANLKERQQFRSTAYHSTVQVDQVEQNRIEESVPFVIGNEARPKVLSWQSNADGDFVVAEHYGYQRLPQPITHRRSILFDKRNRFWLIEDELTDEGSHEISFRFHLAPHLEARVRPEGIAEVCDNINGARLLIACERRDREEGQIGPVLENQFSSNDYGAKEPSISVCWSMKSSMPLQVRFALVPIGAGEDEVEKWHRLQSVITSKREVTD